jgi:hypothetical protein
VIVPAALTVGSGCGLAIITQSSARKGAALLKTRRTVRSSFKLTAQN